MGNKGSSLSLGLPNWEKWRKREGKGERGRGKAKEGGERRKREGKGERGGWRPMVWLPTHIHSTMPREPGDEAKPVDSNYTFFHILVVASHNHMSFRVQSNLSNPPTITNNGPDK